MKKDHPMHEQTLVALKGSILKWEAIVAGHGEDMGIDNCPLCKMFEQEFDPDGEMDIDGVPTDDNCCCGCPVANESNFTGCQDTPYIAWAAHQNEKHSGPIFLRAVHPDCPDCRPLAQAELDYLKSLLPKSLQPNGTPVASSAQVPTPNKGKST